MPAAGPSTLPALPVNGEPLTTEQAMAHPEYDSEPDTDDDKEGEARIESIGVAAWAYVALSMALYGGLPGFRVLWALTAPLSIRTGYSPYLQQQQLAVRYICIHGELRVIPQNADSSVYADVSFPSHST